ncbi:MAG: M81 family metallopeptidase [Alphaproteobacteria bacterium]|jgi:microcystin degradation protein MlrC|nr:M81 family metallopeptidase [Alphaproteobacteria bacterium]
MRVFAACLGTETNTFSPIPTGEASFRNGFFFEGGAHPDQLFLFTGPLMVARRRAKAEGWTLIEGLSTFAEPAGPTTRAAYETLRDKILAEVRAALPLDIVLLGAHGAMVADGYDDCEGDLLARLREIVGAKTVIGTELDPHCHVSTTMLEAADFIVCFKEYPHIDFMERAEELVELCHRAARAEVKPVTACFDCRMIGIYHTPREPMRSYVDRIKALEGRDGVLTVSVAHSFPWGDVPDMGTKILVTTDDDQAAAAALAERLGRELIALRGQTGPDYLTIDEALDKGLSHNEGTAVIADSADNPGGGAPSDATFVLERLIDRGIGDVAYGPFWDKVAVELSFAAGVGARLDLRIGGKVGPMSGRPLDLKVEVLALARDHSQSFGAGRMALGDAAALRILGGADGLDIVVVSHRNQASGRELFTGLGIDPEKKRLVIVKSSQHFHAAFAPIAREVLYIGGPGAIATDLKTFDYRRIQRPMWPMDPHPLAE